MKEKEDLSTQELIHHAQSSDVEAAGTLFQRLRPRLRIWAQWQLPRRLRQNASDIVQMTMLEGYARITDFNGSSRSALMAWLGRIQRNNILDEAKRKCNKVTVQPLDDVQDRASGHLTSGASPSLWFQQIKRKDRLHQALQELSEVRRQAVWLRHGEGRSLHEIASLLDRTEIAAADLIRRGVQELRKRLHDIE